MKQRIGKIFKDIYIKKNKTDFFKSWKKKPKKNQKRTKFDFSGQKKFTCKQKT